jgi:hypothetical protein
MTGVLTVHMGLSPEQALSPCLGDKEGSGSHLVSFSSL